MSRSFHSRVSLTQVLLLLFLILVPISATPVPLKPPPEIPFDKEFIKSHFPDLDPNKKSDWLKIMKSPILPNLLDALKNGEKVEDEKPSKGMTDEEYTAYITEGTVKTHLPTNDTIITLVNATPYRWRKGYTHHYQIYYWHGFPDYIEPGQSVAVKTARFRQDDSAAEVAYHLEGTSKPMSFMVERRSGKEHHVFVRFLEDLEAHGNPKLGQYDLGYMARPGGSNFMLAGKEGDFYSTNPPAGWMQSMIHELGNVPLREIVLPRSHHAGLYYTYSAEWMGSMVNAQTQVKDLPYQLGDGGVRVLDVRPMYEDGVFRECHGSIVGPEWNGIIGPKLDEMIEAVNTFLDQNPGELIILDFHAIDAWHSEIGYKRDFDDEDRKNLYQLLKKVKHRMSVSDNKDISALPLKHFIGNKKSAVLLRFDHTWVDFGGFPGGKEGFVTNKNVPAFSHWSNDDDADTVAEDQIDVMREKRPTRNSMIHNSDWTLTQQGLDILGFTTAVYKINRKMYRRLFSELWNAVTDVTYPNWITMDAIQTTDLKSFVVAMNHCLVARKCGSLGGKVGGK